MKVLITIVVLLGASAIIALFIGILAITGAADDMYRELDDQDQAQYIRDWQAKKKAKKSKCRKR